MVVVKYAHFVPFIPARNQTCGSLQDYAELLKSSLTFRARGCFDNATGLSMSLNIELSQQSGALSQILTTFCAMARLQS